MDKKKEQNTDAQKEALRAYAAAFTQDNPGGAKDNGAGPNFTVNSSEADPGFFQKLKDKVGL